MQSWLTPQGWWQALKREWLIYHLGLPEFRFMFDAPPPNEWVSLDCETTGLDTSKDEIISIGAVRIVGDRIMFVSEVAIVGGTQLDAQVARDLDQLDGRTRRSRRPCRLSTSRSRRR